MVNKADSDARLEECEHMATYRKFVPVQYTTQTHMFLASTALYKRRKDKMFN